MKSNEGSIVWDYGGIRESGGGESGIEKKRRCGR